MDFFRAKELKTLNLTCELTNHIAMARFGGPLIVLNKIGKDGSIAKDFICVFDSAGKLQKRI